MALRIAALAHRFAPANRIILVNSCSLVGTTALTSGLGFVYWWLAALLFPPTAVGLASAAISAMMLLGTIGTLGVGTLLIGELPRQPRQAGPLISTALSVAAAASGVLGIVFAVTAPLLSAELGPLAHGLPSIALFSFGATLTGVTLVLDQAVVGLLRSGIQLWRNGVFAAAKLSAIFVAGTLMWDKAGLTIYSTWVIGNLVSMAILSWLVGLGRVRIAACLPRWGLARGLRRAALEHHLLNLALQAPGLALPIIVTTLISAAANASFYAAWMIASFAFVVPGALTTVLYALGGEDPSLLAQRVRFTLKLSFVAGLLGSALLLGGSYQVLGLFGSTYAEQAGWALQILTVGVFPLIIKVHYVAVSRVHRQVASAAKLAIIGGIIEVVAAGAGARAYGLPGLSVGWLLGVCIEVAPMARTVYQSAAPDATGSLRRAGALKQSD
ncbi:MAG: oligosaccharide flippase family protein [Chloroflexi bacterium]|nr:oligosaccharide flippase family protein [Chloroflexota bacterium]MCL5025990.1 oligosaccharide flippase family protein [Chloroflexota bacterium]